MLSLHTAPQSAQSTAPGGWLRPLHSWPRQTLASLRDHAAVVRVLIAGVRGSAPREAGACMLLAGDTLYGTVGGGHLEWQTLRAARELLNSDANARVQKLILGIELGQCCGGVVEVWLERWTYTDRLLLERLVSELETRKPLWLRSALHGDRIEARSIVTTDSQARVTLQRDPAKDRAELLERLDDARQPLWLYGAGHVGQALVRVLAELPLQVTWIDARPGVFPADLPESVTPRATAPLALQHEAPPGAAHIVMTHDHALDYALVLALLQRDDARYLGLIGSASKAARFRSRLRRDGIDEARLARLTCPIGVPGIGSKWPGAIAVGVAAQLMQTLSTPSDLTTSPAPQPVESPCNTGQCHICQAKQS